LKQLFDFSYAFGKSNLTPKRHELPAIDQSRFDLITIKSKKRQAPDAAVAVKHKTYSIQWEYRTFPNFTSNQSIAEDHTLLGLRVK
jgi:hypothetical protein